MKKTIKFLKSKRFYIYSFIITFCLLLLIFGFNNAGFGLKKNILYGDLKEEYMPFFTWLKYAISNFHLIYSFSNGLGDGMFGLISYYM